MMHKAWNSIEEVPYCFARSYVKFQGHTALPYVQFDPNCTLRECNPSLNSPMATKWCTQLEVAPEEDPYFFFKVICQLQFEFTNGYEMMHKAWSSIEEVPYCFSRSSIKYPGHTALKIVEFDPNWMFPDCNSSFNSPMATKWCTKLEVA